jgi:pimeloyl-ACP methyl ester carboxylesterase
MSMRKSTPAFVLIILTVLFISTGCGEKTESEGNRTDWVDKLIDVGGHRLHLRYKGEGSPTVVLDTGIAETYRTWESVVEEIARDTRVYVYDRAGYGESEMGPFPRTAHQVVKELHILLKSAEVGSSFMLVGHSLGALHSVMFAAEYPELVSGIVIVDPPPLEFILGRRFANLFEMAHGQTQEFRRMAAEHRQAGREEQANFFETIASEHDMMFSKSSEHINQISDLGKIPLIVIGSGVPNPEFGDSAQDFQAFWIQSNQQLASLSKQGKFILAEDSSHHVHLDAPGIMISAIRELISTNRNNKQPD